VAHTDSVYILMFKEHNCNY